MIPISNGNAYRTKVGEFRRLQIVNADTSTANINFRWLFHADGEAYPTIGSRVLTATTAAQDNEFIAMSDGVLLSVSCDAVEVHGVGKVLAVAELGYKGTSADFPTTASFQTFVQLFVDFVSGKSNPTFPSTRNSVQPLKTSPAVIAITDPAAGAAIASNTPALTMYEIQAIRFTFATDANVANRWIMINVGLSDGTIGATFVAGSSQAASLTRVYSFNAGQTAEIINTTATNNVRSEPFQPVRICSSTGQTMRINITASGIQVGDQLSGCQVLANVSVNL